MPRQALKTHFLELYRAAYNNAVDLLQHAEILSESGKYRRAYALAFTALEEISKSQLTADVFSGFISEKEFDKHYPRPQTKSSEDGMGN
jgi:AbiV family abortive infection protein